MSHLFTAGSYVEVSPVAKRGKPNSEGGAGCIVGVNANSADVMESFDAEYVTLGVCKKLSREVVPSRLPNEIENYEQPCRFPLA